MSRSVPEWIAKHDDQKIPPRVKLRIFEREDGVCHLTGQKIKPGDKWDADHKIPLILGGEHRESNLFPALRKPHQEKTKAEMAVKSKIAKVKQKHIGIRTAPIKKLSGPGFPKTEKAARRQVKPPLPPRPLYREDTR